MDRKRNDSSTIIAALLAICFFPLIGNPSVVRGIPMTMLASSQSTSSPITDAKVVSIAPALELQEASERLERTRLSNRSIRRALNAMQPLTAESRIIKDFSKPLNFDLYQKAVSLQGYAQTNRLVSRVGIDSGLRSRLCGTDDSLAVAYGLIDSANNKTSGQMALYRWAPIREGIRQHSTESILRASLRALGVSCLSQHLEWQMSGV